MTDLLQRPELTEVIERGSVATLPPATLAALERRGLVERRTHERTERTRKGGKRTIRETTWALTETGRQLQAELVEARRVRQQAERDAEGMVLTSRWAVRRAVQILTVWPSADNDVLVRLQQALADKQEDPDNG